MKFDSNKQALKGCHTYYHKCLAHARGRQSPCAHGRSALVGFPLLSYPLCESRLQTSRGFVLRHGVGKLRQSSGESSADGWSLENRRSSLRWIHLRAQHRSARPIIGRLRWKAIAKGSIALLNSQISPHTCSGVLAVKRVGVESRDVEQDETRSLGVLARASRGSAAIRAIFINHDFTALSLGSTCFSPYTATRAICVLHYYVQVSHLFSVCVSIGPYQRLFSPREHVHWHKLSSLKRFILTSLSVSEGNLPSER